MVDSDVARSDGGKPRHVLPWCLASVGCYKPTPQTEWVLDNADLLLTVLGASMAPPW